MNPILVFREPELYREWTLERAIRDVWNYLFNNFQVVSRSNLLDDGWSPDIIAYSEQEDCFLITELKATARHSSFESTCEQIIGYAKRFLSAHPMCKVKLLVLGPWASGQVQRDRISIKLFSYIEIGQYLLMEFGGNFFGPVASAQDCKNGVLLEEAISTLSYIQKEE